MEFRRNFATMKIELILLLCSSPQFNSECYYFHSLFVRRAVALELESLPTYFFGEGSPRPDRAIFVESVKNLPSSK